MKKFKRLKVMEFAKFQTVLAMLLGLLCGVFYSLGGLHRYLGIFGGAMKTPGLSYGTLLAWGTYWHAYNRCCERIYWGNHGSIPL